MILFILILHLFALTDLSNPIGSNFNNYKISFHQYFPIKD